VRQATSCGYRGQTSITGYERAFSAYRLAKGEKEGKGKKERKKKKEGKRKKWQHILMVSTHGVTGERLVTIPCPFFRVIFLLKKKKKKGKKGEKRKGKRKKDKDTLAVRQSSSRRGWAVGMRMVALFGRKKKKGKKGGKKERGKEGEKR